MLQLFKRFRLTNERGKMGDGEGFSPFLLST